MNTVHYGLHFLHDDKRRTTLEAHLNNNRVRRVTVAIGTNKGGERGEVGHRNRCIDTWKYQMLAL